MDMGMGGFTIFSFSNVKKTRQQMDFYYIEVKTVKSALTFTCLQQIN